MFLLLWEGLYIENKGEILFYQFIECIPIAAISRGITIKLHANVGDIDLDKLDDLESLLDEKLPPATKNKQIVPTDNSLLDKKLPPATENKQTVQTDNSFYGTLTKTVAPSSQPTITPATERVPTYTAPQINAINVQQNVDAKANRQELEAKATRIMEGDIMQAESAAMRALLDIDLISPQKETLDKIFIAIVRRYTT